MDKSKIGIIFDMDGTMVDNMEVHHQAWKTEFNKNGIQISIEEVREKIHGKNEGILKKIYGEQLSEERIQQLAYEKELAYRVLYQNQIKLIDGLEELITDLRQQKIKIGIGTAAPVENLDFVLDGLGIRHWFDAVVHAGMVKAGKPNPEVFLKVADLLQVSPSQCLVFEDSPTGAQAAAHAKMKLIVVGKDYPQEQFQHIQGIQQFINNYQELRVLDLVNLIGQ